MAKTYEDFFLRFGNPSNTAEGRIYYNAYRPSTLQSVKDVRREDDHAAHVIAECQELLAFMTKYRQELAQRYGALETMSYKETLLLKRDRYYKGTVYFTIWNIKEYEDGTKQETQLKHYEGKDRSQAIKDFDALVKSHPGVAAIKQIEKSKWER